MTLSVSDNTELSQDISGEYHPVPNQYYEGRVVLKHSCKDRFLRFCYGDWNVDDKMSGSGSWIARCKGGRRTVCPGQDNSTKWRDMWRDKGVTVTVKCHTHN